MFEFDVSGPEKQIEPKTMGLKEKLEIAGKLLVGFVGLCYVLGLLVVTIHLRQYGLNSLSLSQLHYVTAGFWTLLPILMAIFFVALMFYALTVNSLSGEGKKIKIEDVIGGLFGMSGVFYLLVRYLSGFFGIHLGWKSWLWIPLLGTAAVLLLAVLVMSLIQPDAYRHRQHIPIFTGLAVCFVALFLLYLVLFATHTYEDIPWSTGGGGPSHVQLVVASDARAYLEGIGINFAEGQNRTNSLTLLLVTEKEYVVINPQGNAVGVPTDQVKSVFYEK